VRDATRVGSRSHFVQAAERLDAFGARLVEGSGPVASALRAAQIAPDERATEARNIAIAATETTSVTLTWSLLELARDPVLQAAAAAEDGEALVERVFTETLRLYPPAWYIGRLALADVELAGEPVAEGTMVLVSPYLVHRDERFYERPGTFDPDRWLEGTAAATRAFTFLPFGAGSRRCIGEEIAWLEGRVILAELARSLELEVAGDADVGMLPGASLRPARRVLLRARPRHAALPARS
jgi:cytochrome P450